MMQWARDRNFSPLSLCPSRAPLSISSASLEQCTPSVILMFPAALSPRSFRLLETPLRCAPSGLEEEARGLVASSLLSVFSNQTLLGVQPIQNSTYLVII